MYIKYVFHNPTSIKFRVFNSWHQNSFSYAMVGVFVCYLGTRFHMPGASDRLSLVPKIKEKLSTEAVFFFRLWVAAATLNRRITRILAQHAGDAETSPLTRVALSK